MTENTHWYWTPGKSYSMQHLCFPGCYYLNIGVGTHFTVVPSRKVVREKVVWGWLQRCWRVTCRIFPCYTMKSLSVPTQHLSFSFPLILLKWVWFFFLSWHHLFTLWNELKTIWKLDPSLYVWGPFPHQCFDPPWRFTFALFSEINSKIAVGVSAFFY